MESAFEQHGFFDTLVTIPGGKQVGNRPLAAMPEGRKAGSAGATTVVLTGDVVVDRGHKKVTLRHKEPTTYFSVIFPLCGRMKTKA